MVGPIDKIKQYNTLYNTRTWLKIFNVSLASERRQRILANESVGENLTSKMVSFVFHAERGGEVFHEAPFVFVRNLIAKVADKLTQHLG